MKSENMVQPEPREEWIAPELKKIDIEEITALGNPSLSSDAFSGES